jgi:hypothetical protein
LHNKSGLLFANPIPEKFALPKAEIDFAIDQAVREAAEQGFHGHTNTPFILSRIKELTKGNSLPANRALIESNVAMAAKVAVELSGFKAGLYDTSASDQVIETLSGGATGLSGEPRVAPTGKDGPAISQKSDVRS